MKSIEIEGQSIPQYGIIMLLTAALLPAMIKTIAGFGALWLDTIPGGISRSFYLLAEAVILISLMIFFTVREGGLSFRQVIPYQKSLPLGLFILALVLVTFYAISLRDFVRIPQIMTLTQSLMKLTQGWPPEWVWTPDFSYRYQDVSGASKVAAMLLGMFSIAMASVAQTLYFRGFLMARMEKYGWVAPIFSTVLFAFFHINSPAFWPMYFIFTLGWGVVTYITRNVWISVISHMIFNTYTFMIAFYSMAMASGIN